MKRPTAKKQKAEAEALPGDNERRLDRPTPVAAILPAHIRRDRGWLDEDWREAFKELLERKRPEPGLYGAFRRMRRHYDAIYKERKAAYFMVTFIDGDTSPVVHRERWDQLFGMADYDILSNSDATRVVVITRSFEPHWSPSEKRQDSDLVSSGTVQDRFVPREPTPPAQARGKPGLRHGPPLPEARHEVTRPAQTPAVEWPAAGWQKLRGQGGAKKMHAIVDYLRVKWKPFLDATGAAVTLEILEQKDPGAGTALRRYLERHPMPAELQFVRHDEVMNILAERPTRLVDVASCPICKPGMQ